MGGDHHIRYKSQGGSDIRPNLIRLCMHCHRGIHDARYDRTELIAIVAGREGMTPEEVAQAVGIGGGRSYDKAAKSLPTRYLRTYAQVEKMW